MRKYLLFFTVFLVVIGWATAVVLDEKGYREEPRYHPNGAEPVYVGVFGG